MMDAKQVKNIIEACLLVAGKAMSLRQIDNLFEGDEERPDKETIKTCIDELQADYEGRGIELVHVASGYRLQSRTEVSHWVARLFPEKPPRYSRALLETLVLVAYRQPITRGEIEEIRGVAVSSNIVKTLQEREWVKEVGFKDVPGKPALLGTTRQFLDYFNLKRLDDLPPLSDVKNLDEMDAALMEAAGIAPAEDTQAANDDERAEDQQDANAAEDGDVSGDAIVAEGSDVSAEENVAATATATATAGDDIDTAVSADADASLQEREQTLDDVISDDLTTSLSEGDLEQTSFIAGSANGVELESDEETLSNADSDAQTTEALEVIATDDHDAPVTFAGLLSDLPPLQSQPVGEHEVGEHEVIESSSSDETGKHVGVTVVNDEQSQDSEAPAEPVGEEQKLFSKISEFAEDHRKDVDARDELETQLKTRYTDSEGDESSESAELDPNSNGGGFSKEAGLVSADSDEKKLSEFSEADSQAGSLADSLADSLGDAIDASSTSIDVLSETFTGDSSGAGETLH